MTRAPYLLATLLLLPLPSHTSEDPRLAEGRAASQAFATELKAALTGALQTGGPAKAIEVCASQAPSIAQRLSQQHGAVLTRVSLKPRNPAASPNAWQRATLEDFEQRKTAGEPVERLESLQHAEGETRYMKAIPTQPLCLSCHGTQLSTEVKSALAARYPHDQATGFEAGDLRGAFSIVWRAPAGH